MLTFALSTAKPKNSLTELLDLFILIDDLQFMLEFNSPLYGILRKLHALYIVNNPCCHLSNHFKFLPDAHGVIDLLTCSSELASLQSH